eukprot:12932869-Alexandrium_andersonii.AAC.1
MCIRDSVKRACAFCTVLRRSAVPAAVGHKAPVRKVEPLNCSCEVAVSYTHLRAHETSAHL